MNHLNQLKDIDQRKELLRRIREENKEKEDEQKVSFKTLESLSQAGSGLQFATEGLKILERDID